MCVHGTNECVRETKVGECGRNVGQETDPTTEKRTAKVRKKKVTWGGELGEPVTGKSKGSKRNTNIVNEARRGQGREEQEKREKELTGFLLHNDLYTHWPASWVDDVDEEESDAEEGDEDEEQERFREMYERMVVKKRKAKEQAAAEKGKNGVHVSGEGDQRKKEGKSKRDKKKEHQKEGSDPVVMTNASVKGKVNGVDQDILIDTGAARSLVNITLLPKNTVWYVLRHQRPTKVQLTFAGGRTQAADGEVTLFFEIGGHRWREKCLMVSTCPYAYILGWPSLKREGMVLEQSSMKLGEGQMVPISSLRMKSTMKEVTQKEAKGKDKAGFRTPERQRTGIPGFGRREDVYQQRREKRKRAHKRRRDWLELGSWETDEEEHHQESKEEAKEERRQERSGEREIGRAREQFREKVQELEQEHRVLREKLAELKENAKAPEESKVNLVSGESSDSSEDLEEETNLRKRVSLLEAELWELVARVGGHQGRPRGPSKSGDAGRSVELGQESQVLKERVRESTRECAALKRELRHQQVREMSQDSRSQQLLEENLRLKEELERSGEREKELQANVAQLVAGLRKEGERQPVGPAGDAARAMRLAEAGKQGELGERREQ